VRGEGNTIAKKVAGRGRFEPGSKYGTDADIYNVVEK
jgi:hypothetical protein